MITSERLMEFLECVRRRMIGRTFKNLGEVQREFARVSKECSKMLEKESHSSEMEEVNEWENIHKIDCFPLDDTQMVCVISNEKGWADKINVDRIHLVGINVKCKYDEEWNDLICRGEK